MSRERISEEKRVGDGEHSVLSPSKSCPKEESTQTLNELSSGNKTQEAKSTENKRRNRKKTDTRESLEHCKQDGNSVAENRPLRSHSPHKRRRLSTAENGMNLDAENRSNKQKRIQRNARASVKDDASRIKMRVKYFLNRINREQSLIDAYSGDGWKGQSHEKVRPEQELKRAERQILQCKLGIRKEIEQIEKLSLEGSIEEAAFDEEGQIHFDDIFCAICKSKEVLPENDIILCDGACDRAFHQFCLDPPLKTEDIPPGDEGWLCPICDCKFECFDAINDYLGTDFEIEDSWEKVFPELEEDASCDGNGGMAEVDWPSEDSEDDDYNPEKPKSSEQDRTSKDNEESDDNENSDLGSGSSSDSDSNSSDSSGVVFFDEFAGTSKGKKRTYSNDDGTEGLSEEEEAIMVTGKRKRPEVDYKQLHDEVFGANASDESSEDEDWRKRKWKMDTKDPNQPKQEMPSEVKSEKVTDGERTRSRKRSIRIAKEILPRLQEVFKECELPSKDRKQALSSELALSFKDVNTWFRNTRRNAARKRKLRKKLDTSTSMDSGKEQAPAGDTVCQENGV